MSEIDNDATRQELEKLRLENSELKKSMLFHAEAVGQMHKIDVKIKQLESLLIRAADALENSPGGDHAHLVGELRKAAE